jgi:hypothetical protein
VEDIVKQDLIDAFSGSTAIDEQTTSSDAGAYVTPQVWAKNENNWRALKDPNFPMYGGPGGKFVKVKKKCSTFPYCNQGDINALDFYETPKKKKKKKNKKKRKNKLTPLGRRRRKIAKDLVKTQRIKTPRGKHYNIGRRISEDTRYLYYNELTQKEAKRALIENIMNNRMKNRSLGKNLENAVRKSLVKEQIQCGVCGDITGTGDVTTNDATALFGFTTQEINDIVTSGNPSSPLMCPDNVPTEGGSGILNYIDGNITQLTCNGNSGSGSGEISVSDAFEDPITRDDKEIEKMNIKRRTQSHGYGCDCGDGNYDETCCGSLLEQKTHQAQKLYAKLDKEQGKSNTEGIRLAAEKIKKFMKDDKGENITPPMYRNNKKQDEFVEDVYYGSGQTGIEYDQPLTDEQKKRHAAYLNGSIETGNNVGKGVDKQQVANITMSNAEGGANNAGEMLAKAAERRAKNLAIGQKMANNNRRYSPDVQTITSKAKITENVVRVHEHVIDTPEQILALTPSVYKIDGREWEITNGKDTKKVRYESFIGRKGGTVVILEEKNQKALTEEIGRIKNMFNHNTNTRHNNFL